MLPVLFKLNWLPIKSQFDDEVLLMTFVALNGLVAVYLVDLHKQYSPSQVLCSAQADLLLVPKKMFFSGGILKYNSVSENIRNVISITVFKSK